MSQSHLQLLGTATDESLRFWSSHARLDKYTYKWKRDRMQKHISGSQTNCKHTFWKHNETKTRQQRSVVQILIWIKIQIKYKVMNSTRTSNYSATSLNQAPLGGEKKNLKSSLAKHASAAKLFFLKLILTSIYIFHDEKQWSNTDISKVERSDWCHRNIHTYSLVS